MITNERQYRITKAQLKRFDEAATAQASRDRDPGVDPRIHAAMGAALRSEADELRRKLRAYEQLRAGRVKRRTLRSLKDVPTAIIEARIAGRVTQKGLADRLGVAEQQVQRWKQPTTRASASSASRTSPMLSAHRSLSTSPSRQQLRESRAGRRPPKRSRRRTASCWASSTTGNPRAPRERGSLSCGESSVARGRCHSACAPAEPALPGFVGVLVLPHARRTVSWATVRLIARRSQHHHIRRGRHRNPSQRYRLGR